MDLEAHRDLVADHQAAARPLVDAELAAIDLRGRGETGPPTTVRARADPGHRDSERHVPGDAVQRQVTVDDPALAGAANAGGAVTGCRVLGDIEEGVGTDVLVTLLVACVKGRELDGRLNRRPERVFAGNDRDVVAGESAADGGDKKLADGEGDVGV